MKKETIIITKASGEQVPFDVKKLSRSLQRSGASDETVQQVLAEVKEQLFTGISTKQIFQLAFSLLRRASRSFAARYKLKSAIMELGPSGYPFERYVSEILASQGYTTKTGEIMQGYCVTHEIDVLAEKGDEHIMVECKYHNLPGNVCDVKIPLYIYARFQDVVTKLKQSAEGKSLHYTGYVFTNTKFSGDAIQYGQCMGLNLVGWNVPFGSSLKDLIEQSELYPLTCLTTLSRAEKKLLLEQGIVLCLELLKAPEMLQKVGIKVTRFQHILSECRLLCHQEDEIQIKRPNQVKKR